MRNQSVDEMLIGASIRRYICEVHREIYDLVESGNLNGDKEHCLNLIAEAYWMGKRMSERLTDFREKWQADEVWEDNLDYHHDLAQRAARFNLLKNIKSVSIETIDYCNRKCSWCPNKDRETSPNNIMPWDVLMRILRQLLDYQYTGRVNLFLRGEPTMDPRLVNIVAQVRYLLKTHDIRIVTNGDGLDAQRTKALFDAGVTSIHYNHYNDRLSNEGKLRDADFPGMSHFGLKALMPTFNNRAGKVDFNPEKSAKQCHNFLNKLVFTTNGDVILCCNDWDKQVIFGNIMVDALSVIMNSELYRKYYYAHKEGRAKEMPLCRGCNLI